jgi:hypothetical protein
MVTVLGLIRFSVSQIFRHGHLIERTDLNHCQSGAVSMKRKYALIAILTVAGCSNPADTQRIRELEDQLAKKQEQRRASLEMPEQAPAPTPEPKVYTRDEVFVVTPRGMTADEVKRILGPPDDAKELGCNFRHIEWTYWDRYIDPDTEKIETFTIILESRKVYSHRFW